ncbi:hypothetical protein LC607_02220 [Nostoc sp. CHAB 5824]|nr:hypothetical protein [Nostoc sp. CHAB 5824]
MRWRRAPAFRAERSANGDRVNLKLIGDNITSLSNPSILHCQMRSLRQL